MIATAIITESPLADVASCWAALLTQLAHVEDKLGWRYIWESRFDKRVAVAAAQVTAAYRQASAWEPADSSEAANRAALMADLCAYDRALYSIGQAIAAWPSMPANAPDPRLADLLATAGRGPS